MVFFFEKILNIIFPEKCILCNKPSNYVCLNCLNQIPQIKKCIYQTDNIFALYSFSDGDIKKIIKLLKYKNAQSVAKPIANKMYEFIKKDLFYNKPKKVALIPIPTIRSVENKRGFNQALLIANELAKYDPKMFSVYSILKKRRSVKQQTKLSFKKDRIKNSINMFNVIKKPGLEDADIFIIDDVVTTGATIKSARKVLKEKYNDKKIIGLAFAYQPL